MKIDNRTVIFKSYPSNYEHEKNGRKPCTVRLISKEELASLVPGWLDDTRTMYALPHRIRIVNAVDPSESFERWISYCQVLGEVLYQKLVLICWWPEVERGETRDPQKEIDRILCIVKKIENDPKLREEMEEAQRKYGTLTPEDLRKQFTI